MTFRDRFDEPEDFDEPSPQERAALARIVAMIEHEAGQLPPTSETRAVLDRWARAIRHEPPALSGSRRLG